MPDSATSFGWWDATATKTVWRNHNGLQQHELDTLELGQRASDALNGYWWEN